METYNILVVDDDREIVKSLGKLLELEGYEIYKAYDGMEALELLMQKKIHLILLDVMMPKLNGLAALMKIREKTTFLSSCYRQKQKKVIRYWGCLWGQTTM